MTLTYNTHTLPNGLRVIHLHDHSEVVYCGYAIKAGTRYELVSATTHTEEGLAHFCEHMTFKGTPKLSPIRIINSLERVGGELNAYTAKEETVYYASVLNKYFNRAVDLLTEIVFHSEYPQSEIEREQEVVCDEIESYNDSPAELIYDEFENEIFHDHTLGHNVLGSPDTVRSFTTEDCRRFTGRLYRPDRSVFYVVGNVNFPSLIKRLERLLSGMASTPSTEPTATTPPPAQMPPVLTKTIQMNTHQNHVMMGTVISGDINRWRIPLFIANNILGGPGMNSRLNLSLRERRGLVYSVESLLVSYTDALTWTVYFGCDPHDCSRCRRLTMSELHRLQRAPLSDSILKAYKRQLKGQLVLAAQNRESFAIDMAKLYLHYGRLKNPSLVEERIDAVTPTDIHSLMNTVLSHDRIMTLIFK